MIFLGLGTGGIKSNVSPLIAEQYTETRPRIEVKPDGERVVVDPAVTIQSLYNIYYWCINIGAGIFFPLPILVVVVCHLSNNY